MKKILATVILVSLLLPCLVHAESNIDELLYAGFKNIENFGAIEVYFEDAEVAQKKGLNMDELTDYVKLRFKNNFGKIKYTEVTAKDGISKSKDEQAKIGIFSCRVWVVGDADYPIANHILCKAGNYDKLDIWQNESLGFGSKSQLLETIKANLNALIEQCAIAFFKARGEL